MAQPPQGPIGHPSTPSWPPSGRVVVANFLAPKALFGSVPDNFPQEAIIDGADVYGTLPENLPFHSYNRSNRDGVRKVWSHFFMTRPAEARGAREEDGREGPPEERRAGAKKGRVGGAFILSPSSTLASPPPASPTVAMADNQTTTPIPTWSQRAEALTHILIHPSYSPSLHSQLFLASRVPCPPPGSPYPPVLCPGASLLRWALSSVFLPRASRLCLPPSSWRSRCPFQIPPPLVPSVGIEPAPERWGKAELREYALRRRARRGPMRARPPVSVEGVVLTTVFSVTIIAVILRELFWIRRDRI